MALKRHKVL